MAGTARRPPSRRREPRARDRESRAFERVGGGAGLARGDAASGEQRAYIRGRRHRGRVTPRAAQQRLAIGAAVSALGFGLHNAVELGMAGLYAPASGSVYAVAQLPLIHASWRVLRRS